MNNRPAAGLDRKTDPDGFAAGRARRQRISSTGYQDTGHGGTDYLATEHQGALAQQRIDGLLPESE